AEPQILIETPWLLVVQIDVEQLAHFDRLRDGVIEVQAGHLLVGELGIDADHVRMIQRRNEREIRSRRGEVDVSTRLVRLRLERESQPVTLIPRISAEEVDRVAEPFDRL